MEHAKTGRTSFDLPAFRPDAFLDAFGVAGPAPRVLVLGRRFGGKTQAVRSLLWLVRAPAITETVFAFAPCAAHAKVTFGPPVLLHDEWNEARCADVLGFFRRKAAQGRAAVPRPAVVLDDCDWTVEGRDDRGCGRLRSVWRSPPLQALFAEDNVTTSVFATVVDVDAAQVLESAAQPSFVFVGATCSAGAFEAVRERWVPRATSEEFAAIAFALRQRAEAQAPLFLVISRAEQQCETAAPLSSLSFWRPQLAPTAFQCGKRAFYELGLKLP